MEANDTFYRDYIICLSTRGITKDDALPLTVLTSRQAGLCCRSYDMSSAPTEPEMKA